MRNRFLAPLLIIVAPVLLAQPAEPPEEEEPQATQSEVEVQLYRFENFFQARGGAPEEDVNALGIEYRAMYRPRPAWPDIYGALYVINYFGTDTETTYGGRAGASHYGPVHWFNAYVDRMQNGYGFDIEETTASANITTLYGSYTYRLSQDWQVGLDTYNDWQSFDRETGFENDYQSLALQVRYRGFGRVFEPRIGYSAGRRDVRNDRDTYDDRFWYLQLTSEPHPRVTATLRFRDRTRDYVNIQRVDDRRQWLIRAVVRQTERWGWIASYQHEDVDSSLPARDFDTGRLFLGVNYGF